ncbi:MAG: DUF488 domain-containing protein [Desulfobacteraceae bacterium]|nr:MAG: DUF488 domain-containing protein [Desulfobacteraceae bacterium]
MLKIKRVYEKKESSDGKRILVDRLWPRGLQKADAEVDEWMKEIAPSPELRKWFGHDPGKWVEFKRRYARELSASDKAGLVRDLAREASTRNVTLLYGAKDTEHSHAKVLEEAILKRMGKETT